ncbi:MAG: methyltransferase domain-containing protein [Acidobacteria bacterium]|nr:methyltransferase domain-containing protein [Acidobacteriota bacterium]
MGVTYVGRDEAMETVASRIEDVEVVLDLGPGIVPQTFVKKPYVHICVDAHRPYIERVKREVGDDPRYVFLNATWDTVVPLLPDKSVDTVFALEFIEHLEKEDGLRMLREAERVARKQVVVGTPCGFYHQHYEDPTVPDRWGMDGAYWQSHRSGWQPEDFPEGWEFIISPDFIVEDEHDHLMEEPMPQLWALRNLGPEASRRYFVMEGATAWEHFKLALEQGMPPAVHRGFQSAWRGLLRVTGRKGPAGRAKQHVEGGGAAAAPGAR